MEKYVWLGLSYSHKKLLNSLQAGADEGIIVNYINSSLSMEFELKYRAWTPLERFLSIFMSI